MSPRDQFSKFICVECGLKVSASFNFMEFCSENQRLLHSPHFQEDLLVEAFDEHPVDLTHLDEEPQSEERPPTGSPSAVPSPPVTTTSSAAGDSSLEALRVDEEEPLALSTMVECQLNEDDEESPQSAVGEAPSGDALPPGNPYRCSVCFREFGKKANVLSHFQTQHTNLEVPSAWKYDIEPSKCPLCGDLVECLTAHLEFHAGRRTFKCQSCEWAFYSKNYLSIHAAKLHKADAALDAKPDRFACKLCPPGQQQCRDYDELVAHYRQWHLNEMKNKLETCPVCAKETRYLKVHLQKHHSGNCPFKCHFCDKAYAKERYLLTHLSTAHRDREAPPPPPLVAKAPPPVVAVNPMQVEFPHGPALLPLPPPPPMKPMQGTKRPRQNFNVQCVKCHMEFPNNRMLNMHIQRYHTSSGQVPVTAEMSVTAVPTSSGDAKKPSAKRRRASVAAPNPPKDLWTNSALEGMLRNLFNTSHSYEA